jgi:hypothetical protein
MRGGINKVFAATQKAKQYWGSQHKDSTAKMVRKKRTNTRRGVGRAAADRTIKP